MPWRDDPAPYRVWISEIMLQQTQVDTVIPYFERFISRFPTLKSLAEAPVDAVLKAWEGLGYYSRACNLHRAAGEMMARYHGRVPERFDELLTLPGIGPYSAAAIASIAFGESVPSVDGNVLRVIARLRVIREDTATPAVRRRVFEYLERHIRGVNPSDFNQALMELGALICRPRNPACERCPVRRWCGARRAGCERDLPVKVPRGRVPLRHGVAALAWDGDRLLIVRRPDRGLLGGLWDLPGCEWEPDRGKAGTALRAAVWRQAGVRISQLKECGRIEHVYSHFKASVAVFTAVGRVGRDRQPDTSDARWVSRRELSRYAFGGAARRVLRLCEPPPGEG